MSGNPRKDHPSNGAALAAWTPEIARMLLAELHKQGEQHGRMTDALGTLHVDVVTLTGAIRELTAELRRKG